MFVRLGLAALVLATAANADARSVVQVSGRVVDAKGQPVAGVRIAESWLADHENPLKPARPAVSAKDGRFTLELDLFGRDAVVMAVDATGILGGVAIVRAKSPNDPVEISLAPLVETHARYVSKNRDRSLGETYISWSLAGENLSMPMVVGVSDAADFALKLPPGRYTVRGEEYRHVTDRREVTLEPGKAVDLGDISLKLSHRTRLFGKPAPAWHLTDARGVSKDVQPADFKGKWVVLEFWGYWCGACVGRGLPAWIEFADDHAADSDKFVVLAVHSPNATDFAMLDEKLKPIVRRTWHGRTLPFPILLDTSGQMVKDYGVEFWPTAVLIDPDGRVVEVPFKGSGPGISDNEDFLASMLTPLPAEKRLARNLDRHLGILVQENSTLASLLETYSDLGATNISLGRDDMKAAGIDKETPVPLKALGNLSLRAWLNLTLEPFNLTYVRDGDGLRIVRRTPDNGKLSQPSPWQSDENALVAESLHKKVKLDFHEDSLKEVIATLESKTDEIFLIDPVCRKAGTIDPESTVTGSAVDEPLSTALPRLLAPLEITFVVRNEAVILTKPPEK